MKHNVQRGILGVRAESAPSWAEVKASIEAVNQAFATFKEEHGKQLEDAKNGMADALQALKVDNISAAVLAMQKDIDSINSQRAAAQMGVGGNQLRDAEYTEAFQAHMKKGEVMAALNKGSDTDGGYLAPVEWDRSITNKLIEISPMRELCSVQVISGAGYTKLYQVGGTASGWVEETDARPETGTPKFKPLTIEPMEIYANPAATQQMLDDSEINLEQWLAGEVQTEFAKQEGAAFVSGNDSKKPKGILTYVEGGSNAAVHPFGAIKVVSSGDANLIASDAVIDLKYSLPSQLRRAARFGMHNDTQQVIMKLKDGQGNYLWQPSYAAGQPATIVGYAISEIPDMPTIAAGSLPILFGDFKETYLIIDRVGVRVLRDPYTNKPYVSFYTTKRVGGSVVNPEPMRAMKIGA